MADERPPKRLAWELEDVKVERPDDPAAERRLIETVAKQIGVKDPAALGPGPNEKGEDK